MCSLTYLFFSHVMVCGFLCIPLLIYSLELGRTWFYSQNAIKSELDLLPYLIQLHRNFRLCNRCLCWARHPHLARFVLFQAMAWVIFFNTSFFEELKASIWLLELEVK